MIRASQLHAIAEKNNKELFYPIEKQITEAGENGAFTTIIVCPAGTVDRVITFLENYGYKISRRGHSAYIDVSW